MGILICFYILETEHKCYRPFTDRIGQLTELVLTCSEKKEATKCCWRFIRTEDDSILFRACAVVTYDIIIFENLRSCQSTRKGWADFFKTLHCGDHFRKPAFVVSRNGVVDERLKRRKKISVFKQSGPRPELHIWWRHPNNHYAIRQRSLS